MITYDRVADRVVALRDAIKGAQVAGHMANPSGLDRWIEELTKELTEVEPDRMSNADPFGGSVASEECEDPGLLAKRLRWKAGGISGWLFLLPILFAWLMFGLVERRYRQAQTELSLFAWWNADGFPAGLGPASLSFVIAGTVTIVGFATWRQARVQVRRDAVESEVVARLCELCAAVRRLNAQKKSLLASAGSHSMTMLASDLSSAPRASESMVEQVQVAVTEMGRFVGDLTEHIRGMQDTQARWVAAMSDSREVAEAIKLGATEVATALEVMVPISEALRESQRDWETHTDLAQELQRQSERIATTWIEVISSLGESLSGIEERVAEIKVSSVAQRENAKQVLRFAQQLKEDMREFREVQRQAQDVLVKANLLLAMADAFGKRDYAIDN